MDMPSSHSWLQQIAQQWKDLTYEDGSPVVVSVFVGPTAHLDQQSLPCVSLALAESNRIVALLFVCKLAGESAFPTTSQLDAEQKLLMITDTIERQWNKRGSVGYLNNYHGTIYCILEYRFWR